jgi:hypothetical protein
LHSLLLKVREFPAVWNPFSKPAISVKGCSDDDTTIRCWGGNSNDNWKLTQQCMKELGNTEDCYCWGNMRYFAVANNNFEEFKACCNAKAGGASGRWNQCWTGNLCSLWSIQELRRSEI